MPVRSSGDTRRCVYLKYWICSCMYKHWRIEPTRAGSCLDPHHLASRERIQVPVVIALNNVSGVLILAFLVQGPTIWGGVRTGWRGTSQVLVDRLYMVCCRCMWPKLVAPSVQEMLSHDLLLVSCYTEDLSSAFVHAVPDDSTANSTVHTPAGCKCGAVVCCQYYSSGFICSRKFNLTINGGWCTVLHVLCCKKQLPWAAVSIG